MDAIFANVIGIVGWKNSGKTTLVEKLVRELVGRGLRVSTIKHAHHDFDIDHPGKDSYRHRAAGAQEVIAASAHRWALVHESRGAPEPSLAELLAKLAPCDLVVVEGFKHGPHAKIEVRRTGACGPFLAAEDDSVIAVATDDPALAHGHPSLPLDDAAVIADFVCGAKHVASVPVNAGRNTLGLRSCRWNS
jgi:molybdopterin-guanine dinucleotide biosynthesis protein MobB